MYLNLVEIDKHLNVFYVFIKVGLMERRVVVTDTQYDNDITYSTFASLWTIKILCKTEEVQVNMALLDVGKSAKRWTIFLHLE